MTMLTCCFCFDLKTGSTASAVFVLITRTLAIIAFSITLGVYHSQYTGNNYELRNTVLLFIDIYLGAALAGCILFAIFSVMLIFAVKKENKCMFWPWMIYMGIEIAGELFYGILLFIVQPGVLKLIGLIVFLIAAFNIYMLSCVGNCYQQINSQNAVAGYVLTPTQVMQSPVGLEAGYPAQVVVGQHAVYPYPVGQQNAAMIPNYSQTATHPQYEPNELPPKY